MTQERLVFPIEIEGYGEIQGMSGWQDFILHYKQKMRAFNCLRKYVAGIEAVLGAPDDPETEWSAFEAIQKLKGDDIERLKPEHYKMVGEDINKKSDTVEKLIAATIVAEEDSFEAIQALNEDAVDAAIAANEWVE